jgi:hypothetical protein
VAKESRTPRIVLATIVLPLMFIGWSGTTLAREVAFPTAENRQMSLEKADAYQIFAQTNVQRDSRRVRSRSGMRSNRSPLPFHCGTISAMHKLWISKLGRCR